MRDVRPSWGRFATAILYLLSSRTCNSDREGCPPRLRGAVGAGPGCPLGTKVLQGELARPLGTAEGVGERDDGSSQPSSLRTLRTSVPLNFFVGADGFFSSGPGYQMSTQGGSSWSADRSLAVLKICGDG